ncbi:response regulator transcription factor [Cohnella mopanensis]|uniref:response regulator transcription factor n=1 Tax=Cohnella mopanensis TaxID=2911966 RepID=UPI001EF78822|nr:response regulator transcription factor [Cohnella mopanensis]
MDRIKISIAEDQELIRSSLQIVLNMEPDLEVIHVAEDGEQLLKLCENELPDLILMDLYMPVMNGIEATKRVKAKYPQVKVVMLTSFQEMDDVIEVLSEGADSYLLKAMDRKKLVDSLRIVANGGTLINDEVAKTLFKNHLRKNPEGSEEVLDRFQFSQREKDVLRCMKDGLSNPDIAEKLFLSMGTVKNYISSIYAKLNVSDRHEALRKIREII